MRCIPRIIGLGPLAVVAIAAMGIYAIMPANAPELAADEIASHRAVAPSACSLSMREVVRRPFSAPIRTPQWMWRKRNRPERRGSALRIQATLARARCRSDA